LRRQRLQVFEVQSWHNRYFLQSLFPSSPEIHCSSIPSRNCCYENHAARSNVLNFLSYQLRIESSLSLPKIISEYCELVKLCHININRCGPVFWDTLYICFDWIGTGLKDISNLVRKYATTQRCPCDEQEAQLSQTDCSTVHATEYFAKSLKSHPKWLPWVGRKYASIPLKRCLYLVPFLRYIQHQIMAWPWLERSRSLKVAPFDKTVYDLLLICCKYKLCRSCLLWKILRRK